jgi:hypothetical protein
MHLREIEHLSRQKLLKRDHHVLSACLSLKSHPNGIQVSLSKFDHLFSFAAFCTFGVSL